MKIAVLHRYPITEALGTNASFLEFLKILSTRKAEVAYITYQEIVPTEKFSFIKYMELPFKFNRWSNRDKLIKTILWILYVPIFVLRKNKTEKFDLIYCDDSVPYYGFFIKVLNPKTKVFIRLGDLQSGYAWADKSPIFFKFILSIEKFMWQKLDGIVAISDPFKDFIISQVPSLKDKVYVVEESANLEKPHVAIRRSDTDCTFLFHGALLECKGIDLLISAFSDFAKKHTNVRLIIAGGGPEETKLRKLAQALCPNSIEFTGWYNLVKLTEIMKLVDVSIVMRSTNMANNFVVTTCLLENWSFKKPVIAPNLAAFRTVIRDMENGVLFRAGDKHDLQSKLEYMYTHREMWQNLGENGFLTARRVFSHDIIAQKMADILISTKDDNVKN